MINVYANFFHSFALLLWSSLNKFICLFIFCPLSVQSHSNFFYNHTYMTLLIRFIVDVCSKLFLKKSTDFSPLSSLHMLINWFRSSPHAAAFFLLIMPHSILRVCTHKLHFVNCLLVLYFFVLHFFSLRNWVHSGDEYKKMCV